MLLNVVEMCWFFLYYHLATTSSSMLASGLRSGNFRLQKDSVSFCDAKPNFACRRSKTQKTYMYRLMQKIVGNKTELNTRKTEL